MRRRNVACVYLPALLFSYAITAAGADDESPAQPPRPPDLIEIDQLIAPRASAPVGATELAPTLEAQAESGPARRRDLLELERVIRETGGAAGSSNTLLQVYLLARRNDPRYQAARLEYEAVSAGVKEARAGFLPIVAFDYNIGRIRQNILNSANAVFATGASEYGSREQTFSLTQPIFRLGAIKRYEQANAAEKQAAATYAAAEQDLVQRTVSAYLNVLAARDVLDFLRSERDAIRGQLDLAEQRYTSGQATMVNLLDARARVAIKEADISGAQNTLNDRAEALREITGERPEKFYALMSTPLTPPTPARIDDWVDAAVKRNLLVEARAQGVEVARWEVEKQRAGHAPTVDLTLRSNRQTTGGSLFGGGSDVRNNEAFLRLHVPIFSGGAVSALTAQAQKRYEAAQEDLERERRQAARQARAAYEGVTSGLVRIKALEDTRAALEGARELRVEGFKSGLTTMLAVLDAERDLYGVRRDAAQARYDYFLNMLRLKQAAGTLGDEDVEQLSRLMQ